MTFALKTTVRRPAPSALASCACSAIRSVVKQICGSTRRTRDNQPMENLSGVCRRLQVVRASQSCPERINTALYGVWASLKRGVATRLSIGRPVTTGSRIPYWPNTKLTDGEQPPVTPELKPN